jgi:hypothetical protein
VENKFMSKKFYVASLVTLTWIVMVLRGAFVGFPKEQFANAWTFLTVIFTPLIMTFWGWYFKIDIDEKKLIK